MTAVFPIAGRLTTDAIPDLCRQLTSFITCNPEHILLVCDLAALETFDLATIDGLARLQLTARRHDRRIQLRHVPRQLAALITLCGLELILPTDAE